MIDYPDFVMGKAKGGADIKATLDSWDAHLTHMALGLAGELGELVEAISTGNRGHIVEELGDFDFYLTGLDLDLHIAAPPPEGRTDRLSRLTVAVGNLVDEVKRQTVYRKLDGGPERRLLEAAGSVRASLESVYRHLGVHVAEAREANMAKLNKRYADGYSDQAAIERADKAGG